MSISYKFPLIICLCLGSGLLSAQRQSTVPASRIGTYIGSERWIQFHADQGISVSTLWNQYGADMGLGSHDEMTLTKSETDKLGWSHHRFQQVHKGVPVEFAIFNVHAKEGIARTGNGQISKAININTAPALSRDDAFVLALNYINADSYYWQVPRLEEMKRHATGDPNATFYPVGELLIIDEDLTPHAEASYHLAWKFEIYTYQPDGRQWIYIDAYDGAVIKSVDLDMHDHGYPGTAETRYSGIRSIVSDSMELGYILRDHTRGRGVETYDALYQNNIDGAVFFADEDNYWANKNDRADDAATDAHWATEMYYDYLLQRHGFDSYDNHGSKLICYVHVGENWYNASWNGFWTRFGDAGGEPWTHVDVVGHEFTHGFTWATAGLVYSAEPGALNESFSDILGEALQHFTDGGEVDWIATPSPVDTIRSYSNPNAYQSPDTYHGEQWNFGESDNYGVHTNSGVQNHWFYLLAEGGSGVNDFGHAYSVESIGFENAMDVVVRNLSVYLFPTADYFDARQGSLQAAEDIFGACSFEYQQVANAWHAVGVGERVEQQDFTVTRIEQMELCNVSNSAPVRIHVKHLGCAPTGPVTLYLKLSKSNPLSVLNDTLFVADGIGPGAEFSYVFSKESNFSRKGEHLLQATVTCDADLNKENDLSTQIPVYNLSSISDQSFPFHTRVALRTYRDSMTFTVGEFANLSILAGVGRDSTHGIRIEGDQLWYAKPIYRYDDPFDFNERLGTQICYCVDATQSTTLGLQFDLRQTWSNAFQDMVSGDQQKSSILRVMVGDTELARYMPETHDADPWKRRYIDLAEYLGTKFTLCFETRTMIGLDDDHTYNIGDRVFLDNIGFVEEFTSSVSAELTNTPLSIYPNPANEMVTADIPAESNSPGQLFVLDLTGRRIAEQDISLIPGMNSVQVDLKALEAGVYFVEVRTEGKRMMGKVIVNNK